MEWTLRNFYRRNVDACIAFVAFASAYVLWKLAFRGYTETSTVIKAFGVIDVTALFVPFEKLLVFECSRILRLFFPDLMVVGRYFGVSGAIFSHVVWGCTGIKQCFVMLAALLTSRGKHIHKLWFAPVAIVVLHIYNCIRISVMGYILIECPQYFPFFHDFLFRVLFYFLICFVWYVWQLRFNPKW